MIHRGDFPDGPMVDSRFPMQGVWVQSLVGELRSCMPCNATTTSPSLSSAPSVQSSASYSSQLLIRLCLRLDGLGADAEQKSKYKSL